MCRFGLLAFVFVRNCLTLSVLLVCPMVTVLAQGVTSTAGGPTVDNGVRDNAAFYVTAPGASIVVVPVSAEKKNVPLDRQALLQLLNRSTQTATWQTTNDTAQG